MAYIDDSAANSGKTFRSMCLSANTLRNKLLGNALMGGADFKNLAIAKKNAYAMNSPYITKLSKKQILVDSNGKEVSVLIPTSLPDELQNGEYEEVSPALFFDLLQSSQFGRCVQGIIVNGVISGLPDLTDSSRLLRTLDNEFLFCLDTLDNGDFYLIASYFNYKKLKSTFKPDCVSSAVFEGITTPPVGFQNPKLVNHETDGDLNSGTRRKIKQKISSIIDKYIDVLEIDASKTLVEATLEVAKDSDQQELKSLVSKYHALNTFAFDSTKIDPFDYKFDFNKVTWLNEEGIIDSAVVDLTKYIFDSATTCFEDSILSFLWKESKAYASGGVSTDVTRNAAETTMSRAILPRAKIGTFDPLDGIDWDPITSGKFHVSSDIIINDVPIKVSVTTRWTNRSKIHSLVEAFEYNHLSYLLVLEWNETWDDISMIAVKPITENMNFGETSWDDGMFDVVQKLIKEVL